MHDDCLRSETQMKDDCHHPLVLAEAKTSLQMMSFQSKSSRRKP